MTTVLSFGATGNFGRDVPRHLRAVGADLRLRLASSSSEGVAQLRAHHPDAEVVHADLLDPSSLRRAVAGVHKVFVVTPDFMDEETAMGNLVAAARDAGTVRHLLRLLFVLPGVAYADIPPDLRAMHMPQAQHMDARAVLDASGLPVTYLNVLSWSMRNFIWMTGAMIRDTHRIAIPGERSVPYIDPQDVAEVAARILATDAPAQVGECLDLTGAERLSFSEVARVFSEVLGFAVEYADDPEPLRRRFGPRARVLLDFLRWEHPYADRFPLTDAVERLLGRPPRTLRQWLVDNADAFRAG
ncbi:MAG: NmrA family NAD(P)-binding protein [Gammaproteobacteria bacterium]|nr:NmrA family NAD(P)-binding protein [Gammaproteobacteria bacterium]